MALPIGVRWRNWYESPVVFMMHGLKFDAIRVEI